MPPPVPTNILPHRATWVRRTASIFSGTPPLNVALSRTSDVPINVQVEASTGTSGMTVAIKGTALGITTTEILTLTATIPIARGQTPFTAINNVEAAAGSLITGKAVYASGAEATILQTLGSNIPGRLWLAIRPYVAFSDAGPSAVERTYFVSNELGIATGDLLAVNGITYEVEHAYTVFDSRSAHHRRAVLQQL